MDTPSSGGSGAETSWPGAWAQQFGLCSACGVCAGVCPPGALKMVADGQGSYRPALADPAACTSCGLCARVCPFGDGPDEDELGRDVYANVAGIAHTPETGYHLASVVGGLADDDRRLSRTSGGLATWVLAALLEKGWVDRVVCVRPGPGPGRYFEFAAFSRPEEVWGASRSSYYPVEISACLREMVASDLRYAVIGLPCLVKGLRRAQKHVPKLRRNIAFVLGLACSQQCTKWLAEYLIRKAGATPRDVERIDFRWKEPNQPAHRYSFAAWVRGEAEPRRLPNTRGFWAAWSRGYFTEHACRFCDDLFAELADMTFMDAWLPGAIADPRGTSIALARDPRTAELLQAGAAAGELDVRPIGVDQVIRSQVYRLVQKRDQLAGRLSAPGVRLPEGFRRRVRPLGWWHWAERFRRAADMRRTEACKAAFARMRERGGFIDEFERARRRRCRRDAFLLRLLKVTDAPRRLVGRIRRRWGNRVS